jgi:cell division protein FtsI/penicillin-binding protein 2
MGDGARFVLKTRVWSKIAGSGAALAVFGLVLFTVLVAIWPAQWLWNALPALQVRNEEWTKSASEHRTGEAAKGLFTRLAGEDRLIRLDTTSGRIVMDIDCAAENAGLGRAGRDAAVATRIARLCTTDPGQAIRAEIDVWNRSMLMLAVRDTFGFAGLSAIGSKAVAPGTCDNGSPISEALPPGCHSNNWRINLGLRRDDMLVDAEVPETPAGEIFGFLARIPVPGFGDWKRIDTSALGDRPVRLEATLQRLTEATRVSIDVIGRDPALFVGGVKQPPPRLVCHVARQDALCRELLRARPATPHAWRFTVELPKGDNLAIELRSAAVPVAPVEIAELGPFDPISAPPGSDAATSPWRIDERTRLTRNISLVCQVFEVAHFLDDGGVRPITGPKRRATVRPTPDRRYCGLAWDVVVAGRRMERGTVTIRTGEKPEPTPLAEIATARVETAEGAFKETRTSVPTAAARELGLLPLVGFGESDRYSLIGQAVRLVAENDSKSLDLTIDPDIQRLALDQARALVAGDGPNAAALAPGHGAERRASIVLIDAGPARGGYDARAGRVLAAATVPATPRHLSFWDLIAADSYRPAESPLAARAWSQNDRHFAPGSTFKAVVALAAVDRAARGDEKVRRALGLERGAQGGLTTGELGEVFGRQYEFAWDNNTLDVPIRDLPQSKDHEIRNAGETPLCAMTVPPCGQGGRIGLRRALATSSNIWFARLALFLDEARIMTTLPNGQRRESGEPPSPDKPLTLDRVLTRIWPKPRIDLVPGFAERLGRPPLPGARTYATPITLDALLPDRPRRLSLALNGIGQSTQATPLAMASIMASIATGKIVRPRLTPEALPVPADRGDTAWPGDDVIAPEAPDDGGKADPGRTIELLNGLRAGLHDVVTNGSAADAFRNRPYMSNLYGKTGTAETGDSVSSTNSVWFAGWVDGVGGHAGAGRRLAFACVATHMKRDGAFGGSVCAPAIERLLTRLHGEPSVPAGRPAPPDRRGATR